LKKDIPAHKPFPRGSVSTNLVIYLYSFSDANIEEAISAIEKNCESAKKTLKMEVVASHPKKPVR